MGKEKPVMGRTEPLLGIIKPVESLNKPRQGNVEMWKCRKSFAAEGFIVKILSLAKHIRKLWRSPSNIVILELVNLLKYHPRVVLTESFHVMVSTDEEVRSPCEVLLSKCKVLLQ